MSNEESNEKQIVEKKKKWLVPVIIMGATAIFLAVIIATYFSATAPKRALQKQLDIADKYLADLDYENAILAYEAAIEIEPKDERSYLALAGIYESLAQESETEDDLEAALDFMDKKIQVLEQGKQNADSKEFAVELEKAKNKKEGMKKPVEVQEIAGEEPEETSEEKEKEYELGEFSQFMKNATFESAQEYLAEKENYNGFWDLVNEGWIFEDSVTIIEDVGVAVFARKDAVDLNGQGAQGIRDYYFFDNKGNYKFGVGIDYCDHNTAVELAARLNDEIKNSPERKDSWGYQGDVKHFACGECLVHLILTDNSGLGWFSITKRPEWFEGWDIHEY